MRLTVIVPVLNEEETLPRGLANRPPDQDCEWIVVDGGSTDSSRAVAEKAGVRVVLAPRGRGPQMNAGAEKAEGEVLLFVHADTRLPRDAFSRIRSALADPRVKGGAFHLSIEGNGWFYPLISLGANLRARFLGCPYGDACYFVRREDFRALGGYRDLEHCEDLDFIRRLRRRGKVALLPATVSTSGRRWERQGRARILLRNLLLFGKYWLGLIGETPVARERSQGASPRRG